MNTKTILIISVLSMMCGILFFVLYQEWIIIRSPWHISSEKQQLAQASATKKTAKLSFWHNNQWNTETQELIWTESTTRNLQYLITSWLSLLEEEEVLDKKVGVQSAALSSSEHELYISFDRNPLAKEKITFEKWMLIEGLLRTIRENEILLQNVHFLVRHQPLQDPHLDFSNPWPITGFLK